MNPIISPIWIYLIGISTGVQNTLLIAGGVILASIIAFTLFEDLDILKRICSIKKLFFTGLLLIFLAVLTPSEKTCYAMLAASVITPDNIETVGETSKDIVDYIIESVDKLTEENEEE